MTLENFPSITCEITFLNPNENGRRAFPAGALNGCTYRPHIVIGNPNQREANVDEANQGTEEYLGVCFQESPVTVEMGKKFIAILKLPHYPRLSYEEITEGATFTIREGHKVVGFGKVLKVFGK